MKRYLTIFIVLFLFIIRVNAEDYKTGDLIKYKDIKFYVVSDHGNYLTLLKAAPLNKNQDSDLMTQDSDVDIIKVPYCKTDNSTCNFEDSNAKEIIDKWSKKLDDNDLVEVKVTYSDYSSSNGLSRVTKSYKARLLTLNELVTYLDFDTLDVNGDYLENNGLKTPKWVYGSYQYYLMDRPVSNTSQFYLSGGYLESKYSASYATTGTTYGYCALRPVIHLSKKANIVKLKSAVKSIADSEFKTGDIIEYNDMEFYVIKDSSKDDKTITMIKRIPLTLEDITKYKLNNIHLSSYKRYDESTDLVYNSGFVSYYYREDGCSIQYSNDKQCKNDYESSDVKQVVDAWVKDNINKSDIVEDELGYKGRLITLNELINNLGYIKTSYDDYYDKYTNSEETPFYFKGWTMSPSEEDSQNVILASGATDFIPVLRQGEIYPVITVNKIVKPLENKIENKVNVPNTLLNNPIFIVVIGIILILIATITVSLILKRKK